MAKLIDGKAIAADIREDIRKEVETLVSNGHRAPGLAVVIVGERKDSQLYVKMKKKSATEAGLISFSAELPENITQNELLEVVKQFNADPGVDGILVQLPLPKHIREEEIIGAIDISKDVDGLHPLNIGLLAMRGRTPLFVPCTPRGCLELIDRVGLDLKGKHAVVLGRSNIVGIPMSLLLLGRNATVTICHSQTADLGEELRKADVIVAACGQAQLVKKEWCKPGVVVIDVGTNSIDNGKGGTRLVGDVDFEHVKEVASHITPVPGGVGPMTIAMLLKNTLDSAKRQQGLLK